GIARLDDVSVHIAYDQISVRVRRRDVHDLDGLPREVEFDSHPAVQGHDGDRLGIRRVGRARWVVTSLCRNDVAARLRAGEDDGARFPKQPIAADVVPVPMGIDQIADRLRGDPAHRGEDLGVKLRPLRIHQQYAMASGQDADIAAEALQHVHAMAEIMIFHRRLAPVGKIHLQHGPPPRRGRGEATPGDGQAGPHPHRRTGHSFHVATSSLSRRRLQTMPRSHFRYRTSIPNVRGRSGTTERGVRLLASSMMFDAYALRRLRPNNATSHSPVSTPMRSPSRLYPGITL